MKRINLFIPLLALVGIFLLFIYTTSPLDPSKEASQWNLNLYAGVAAVVVSLVLKKKGEFKDFFSVSSFKEAVDRFAVGVIWGGIGIFALNYFLRGTVLLRELVLTNLFGSVPPSFLASITPEGAWFTVLVQPFTETLLIAMVIFIVYSFLSSKRVRGALFIALIVTGLVFSSFHFVSQGKYAYETSLSGYLNYLGDIEGYGKGGFPPSHYGGSCPSGTHFTASTGVCSYTGGLPLLFLGLMWGGLFIFYRNFLEPAGAHAFNNWAVLFFASQLSLQVSTFVNLVGVVFVAVVAFSLWKNGLSGFTRVDGRRFFR